MNIPSSPSSSSSSFPTVSSFVHASEPPSLEASRPLSRAHARRTLPRTHASRSVDRSIGRSRRTNRIASIARASVVRRSSIVVCAGMGFSCVHPKPPLEGSRLVRRPSLSRFISSFFARDRSRGRVSVCPFFPFFVTVRDVWNHSLFSSTIRGVTAPSARLVLVCPPDARGRASA